MLGRARHLAALAVVVGVVVLTGCRPEIDVGGGERQSQIDRVEVTATVGPDGAVHVEQRYEFASDDGGAVGVPDLASTGVPGASGITVDGKPVTPTGGTFDSELRVRARRATVAYDLTGAVQRYTDVAVLTLAVLRAPELASRQDPDLALAGTLHLPEGEPGPVEAHLHGGRNRTVTVEGSRIRFSEDAPIWMPTHDLDVAFPSSWAPGAPTIPTEFLAQFRSTEAIRDQADATTESTLGNLDTQADAARWIITAIAFGLPGIFWWIVVVGIIRRLRARRRDVGPVPEHVAEPPDALDPALVAVLEGEGRPAREAVAGTVLALAQRKAVDLQEVGDRLRLRVGPDATGANPSEEIVLAALRAEASPEGVIDGPPVWHGRSRWWASFRRDAVRRARDAGLATPWMPLLPLSGAAIATGAGAGVFFFSSPLVYLAIVFGSQIVGMSLHRVTGVTLTPAGWRQRARWRAFARYIDDHGAIDRDIGPSGVTVWGPYLAFGAVLGEADAAARPLTPGRRLATLPR